MRHVSSLLMQLLSLCLGVDLAFAQSGIASTRATASAASASASASIIPLGTRAVFGLRPHAMQKSSIFLGVLPDWCEVAHAP
jgi:hypothetical protein